MEPNLAKAHDITQRIRLLRKVPHQYSIEVSLAEKSWRQRVSKQGANGRLRLLMVIAVPPNMTGSGMVVKNLIREHVAAGDDVSLLAAGYAPLDGRNFGLPDSKVNTVVFRDTASTLLENPTDVDFPIPTFSAGMPFPHIRYINMARIQLIDFLEVFHDHLKRIIHRVQPDVIHTHHLFLMNPLVKMIAPWIPLVSQAHETEQKMLQEDSRLLPLVAPAARFVGKFSKWKGIQYLIGSASIYSHQWRVETVTTPG